mmetsp:Transcript_1862/g.3319  ORF Transcript_1862/g.3319 Transcript_1862/m.3319 type:complete len:228 (-) Transcript_1862:801-1484(-)
MSAIWTDSHANRTAIRFENVFCNCRSIITKSDHAALVQHNTAGQSFAGWSNADIKTTAFDIDWFWEFKRLGRNQKHVAVRTNCCHDLGVCSDSSECNWTRSRKGFLRTLRVLSAGDVPATDCSRVICRKQRIADQRNTYRNLCVAPKFCFWSCCAAIKHVELTTQGKRHKLIRLWHVNHRTLHMPRFISDSNHSFLRTGCSVPHTNCLVRPTAVQLRTVSGPAHLKN